MGKRSEDVFRRLEAALAEWDAQISGVRDGLAERVARAGERESGVEDRGAMVAASLSEVREIIADRQALMDALAEYRESARETADTVSALMQAVRDIHAESKAVLERSQPVDQVFAAEIASLRADIAALREQLNTGEDLARAVQELAAHMRLTPEPVSGGHDSSQERVTDELARALRDRDEAHQEIVKLRAEIDALRKRAVSAREGAGVMETKDKVYGFPGISATDAGGNYRRLGEILCEAGVLAEDQLEKALGEQVKPPYRRLGDILVEKGFADGEAVARGLACQLQLPFVRLAEEEIDPQVAQLISGRVASHHACVPLRVAPDRVVLAMANPLDLIAMDDVELACDRTVEPVVATPEDISAAIGRIYGYPKLH